MYEFTVLPVDGVASYPLEARACKERGGSVKNNSMVRGSRMHTAGLLFLYLFHFVI
jgi:hypothetical protein